MANGTGNVLMTERLDGTVALVTGAPSGIGTATVVEILRPEHIADSIAFAVTRPRRTAVNELLVRPTEQER